MMYLFRITNVKWPLIRSQNAISNVIKRRVSKVVDVNTNVAKDIILYKYENPKHYKWINIFALCQFGFWTYLSYFSFTTLRDSPVDRDSNVAWWRKINLGENKYRNTIAVSAFLIGTYNK